MTTFQSPHAQPDPQPRLMREERELIPADSVLAPYVSVNPGMVSGQPCFKGTRVPIYILFEHLQAGDPLKEFLDGFPNVTRAQAVAVIDLAHRQLLGGLQNL
jgi:uncharacterized protein (DUF433 family)